MFFPNKTIIRFWCKELISTISRFIHAKVTTNQNIDNTITKNQYSHYVGNPQNSAGFIYIESLPDHMTMFKSPV